MASARWLGVLRRVSNWRRLYDLSSRPDHPTDTDQGDDTVCLRPKVHDKWESLGNDTANILVNCRVGHRPLSGGSYTTFDFGNELDAKVLPFTFVPCCRFNELCTSRTTKQYRKAHRRMRVSAESFTSLQGTTSSGLAACSESRRSSSAFCASVGPGTAFRSTMLSQSASTNSICSSTDSWRTWSNKDAFIARLLRATAARANDANAKIFKGVP